MKTADLDILTIPGLNGSGPDHWQTRWENRLATARRIEQDDWDNPRLADWVNRIVAAVEAAERPVFLVAHSLGTHALAHAAHRLGDKVKGAFLVAPPSVAGMQAEPEVEPAFHAPATAPLPFPAVVIASRNDPHASFEDAEALAKSWGARLVDAGEQGHINAASGHGPWPEGLMTLAGFLKDV